MSGRVVWITGASSGIGRALAERMMRDGWIVAGSARSAEALQAIERDRPGLFFAVPLDVGDAEAARAAVAGILERHGRIDMAVLAAGTHIPFDAADFRVESFRTLVEINLMGAVHCLAAVVPHFIERRAGHVAVVSSVAGYAGLPTAAAYGASKAALINMTEALKFDLDRHGIKTQLVCPGFVRTPLTDRNDFPMPFLMEPEEAAEAFYAGLRSDAFEIAFPKRFTRLVRLASMLPYGLYFRLMKRRTGK